MRHCGYSLGGQDFLKYSGDVIRQRVREEDVQPPPWLPSMGAWHEAISGSGGAGTEHRYQHSPSVSEDGSESIQTHTRNTTPTR